MNKKEYVSFIIMIIVNLCFCMYFKKHGISYLSGYFYHILIIYFCRLLLINKFEITFSDSNEKQLATFFNGVMYGCLFAIIIFAVALYPLKIFFEMMSPRPPISMILSPNYLIFQFLVAASEELLYRFYLYEELCCLKIKKWLNILICSFVFAYGHFYLHRGLLQFGIAFAFSLFAFYLKNKRNSCNLLIVTHFVYNVVINFLL